MQSDLDLCMLIAKERFVKTGGLARHATEKEAMASAGVVRSAGLVRLSFTHLWEPQLEDVGCTPE